MRVPLVYDECNLYNPQEMVAVGVEYYSIGREKICMKIIQNVCLIF